MRALNLRFKLLVILLVFFSHSYCEEPRFPLSSALCGYAIKDLDTGELLQEVNGAKAFVPASVTKLFTAAAALDLLGEDYRFFTRLLATAPIDEEGVLNGDLILQGGGDPTLTERELLTLCRELAAAGLKKIGGTVVADESYFPDVPARVIHSEWEDLTWYYSPEISALSLNGNCVGLCLSPGKKKGDPIFVVQDTPLPYLDIRCEAVTTDDEISDIVIKRGIDDNCVAISGTLSSSKPFLRERVAVHDPAEYARLQLIHHLQAAGVLVENRKEKRPCCRIHELSAIASPPLLEIVTQMNHASDNLIAELLFFEVKKQFSLPWEAVKEKCSIKEAGFTLHSGSGLSRGNYLTPEDVCSLLFHFPILKSTLPMVGSEGTFKAKTGSMSGVAALAGVALGKSGRPLCFCLFINNFAQKRAEISQMIEEFLLRQIEEL